MNKTMVDLEETWRSLDCLRSDVRIRGGVWSPRQLEYHEKLVAEFDDLVASLPKCWEEWKGSL